MEFIKYYAKKIISLILHVFWIFPIKEHKMFFINDHSYTFSDNLKYLSLYFIEHDTLPYEIFFALKNDEGTQGLPIKTVRFLSLSHFYHALTSSVVITNNGGTAYLPIRKKQLAINTWHGGGPYKVTGTRALRDYYDLTDVPRHEDNKNSHGPESDKRAKKLEKLIYWFEKDLKYNAGKIDYMLSSCEMCTELEAKEMFYSSEQCVDSGMPRIDYIFDPDSLARYRSKVFQYYQIPETSKLILYAPTFRGFFTDYSGALNDNSLELDHLRITSVIKEKFGGEWQFAVRLHPRLKDVSFNSDHLINMTAYPDAQELLMAADMLITDYSSVMWDFSFRKKPCFIFATDMNDYQVKRGFYIPPEEWPFPVATSNDEMVDNINSFNETDYYEGVRKHHEAVGSFESGNACEVVDELIKKHLMKMDTKETTQ